MVSPYNITGQITHGGWVQSHTTNVTVVYPPGQLLTPWPWLVASMGLSLLTAAYSLISDPSLTSHSSFKRSRIGATLSVTINTIRVIALIVLFTSIGNDSYVPSASAVAMLLLSCASTYFSDTPWLLLGPFFAGLLICDFIAVFILLTLRNFAGFGNDYYYGRRIAYGGNCPQIGNCNPKSPPKTVSSLGCYRGLGPFQGDPVGTSPITSINRATNAEFTLGLFVNVTAFFCLAIVLIGMCCCDGPGYFARSHRRKFPRPKNWRSLDFFWIPFERHADAAAVIEDTSYASEDRPNAPPAAPHEHAQQPQEIHMKPTGAKMGKGCAPCLFCFMILVTVISLTFNILYQPRADAIMVYDSFGPFVSSSQLIATGKVLSLDNATSWSDCFTVYAPADRLGFWDQWRTDKESRAAKFISVM